MHLAIHLGMLPELDAQIVGVRGALLGVDLAKGEVVGAWPCREQRGRYSKAIRYRYSRRQNLLCLAFAALA